MRPMCERIDNLLPLFLCLSKNKNFTEKLINQKYLFLDQSDALSRDEFVINADDLMELQKTVSRYFMWVKKRLLL
jgi:hypothetical protein